MNQEKIKELAKQAGMDHPVMGEVSYANFSHEKFAELIVRECIYQIQRGIVLNGITPENKRSEKHISDIAHLFDMEFDYFGDDQ